MVASFFSFSMDDLILPSSDPSDLAPTRNTHSTRLETEHEKSSHGLTLEPFEPPPDDGFTQVRRKKQRLKEKRIRKLLPLEHLFEQQPKYPKYHVISFPGLDIDHDLNPIAADQDLKTKLGQLAKVSKLNKSSLLVELLSENQLQRLQDLKTVATHPVVTQQHKTMNTVKGEIYSPSLNDCTEAYVTSALASQGVIRAERQKYMKNGVLHNKHKWVLTFNCTKLPSLVKLAEWHRELVYPHIPRPLRCTRCQKLGHSKKWCRQTTESCVTCGQEGHSGPDCEKEPLCVNCKAPHPSSSKECPSYRFRCEVLATQVKLHLTYFEAMDIVRDKTPSSGSYAGAVKSGATSTNDAIPVSQVSPSSLLPISVPSVLPAGQKQLEHDVPSISVVQPVTAPHQRPQVQPTDEPKSTLPRKRSLSASPPPKQGLQSKRVHIPDKGRLPDRRDSLPSVSRVVAEVHRDPSQTCPSNSPPPLQSELATSTNSGSALVAYEVAMQSDDDLPACEAADTATSRYKRPSTLPKTRPASTSHQAASIPSHRKTPTVSKAHKPSSSSSSRGPYNISVVGRKVTELPPATSTKKRTK